MGENKSLKRRYTNQVTTMLDDEDYKKIQEVCHKTGMPQSGILRLFFKYHFETFEKQIADGRILL